MEFLLIASLFKWMNLMVISTEMSLSNKMISSPRDFQSIGVVFEEVFVIESVEEADNEPLSYRYFGSLTVVYNV